MLGVGCAPSVCERGQISYYAASLSGNRTANGERYDDGALTAAHRTLPFNAKVRVKYKGNVVVLRVNDRGPFARGRILDVSGRAARELGLVRAGHGEADVCIEGAGDKR